MDKKVVIAGGGIAGLTLSIDLLLKGYKVTLIEKNNEVGGLCSGYFVNGHYIDACLHWLMGTKENSLLYNIWKKVGAFSQDQKFISLPTLGSFEYQGQTVTFYRDIEKTRKELTNLSPADKKAIDKFVDSVKETGVLMSKVQKYKTIFDSNKRKHIRNYSHIIRCMKYSREDYAKRFKHPAIRFAFKNCQTGYNNMFFFLDLYAIFISGNADIPVGGAYYMVQRMKNKFLELGGDLRVNTALKQINVDNNSVASFITDKGEFNGDYFVSCCDPQYTLKTLLNNQYKINLLSYVDKNIDRQTISSCYCLYFTVEGDVSNIDVPTGLHINPIKVGKSKTNFMLVRPYHFDKCFVKENKTVVSIFIDQNQNDYHFYKSLNEDEYQKEINRINKDLLEAFLTRYPEYQGKIESLSFFSPIELNKRTNTSYGSIQSYSFTDKGIFYMFNGKVRGLNNFYLCGQWNRAIGGTPTAILSAMSVSKRFKK